MEQCPIGYFFYYKTYFFTTTVKSIPHLEHLSPFLPTTSECIEQETAPSTTGVALEPAAAGAAVVAASAGLAAGSQDENKLAITRAEKINFFIFIGFINKL
jgi:hypothetical protein